MSHSDNDRSDSLLYQVIKDHKNIDGFLNAIFGFLRRKTDFFNMSEHAKNKINNTFNKELCKFKEAEILEKSRELRIKNEEEWLNQQFNKRKEKEELMRKEKENRLNE